MTATTIKVSRELRDRLKAQAAKHERSIGEHIEVLLDEEARRALFARVRREMAANPPDDDYRADTAEWLSDAWS